MESRFLRNPERIFEVYCEVTRPHNKDQEPSILVQYPPDFCDNELLKSLPKFAFPCDSEGTNVDHFTFTQTDLEARLRFGFCRHATGAQTCLCIVSWFPWYETFYQLLNTLAEVINRSADGNIELLLEEVYNTPVPNPGDILTFRIVSDSFTFTCPDPNSLPAIPSNRNLTEYYNAVDSTNMIAMFASMLFERRILIMSRKLSRVTACIHGAAALIYPMFWQHLYIPIVPPHLVEYCMAPMPYLMGIHTSMYQVSALRHNLKAGGAALLGDSVARIFLRAVVMLIGCYREALRMDDDENNVKKKITFDREKFIASRPEKVRPFLEKMLELQIFEQFIQERLRRLNSGQSMQDEFDLEVNRYADLVRDKDRFKDFARHQGRKGKEKMLRARDKTKEGFRAFKRDVKSRLEDRSSVNAKTATPRISQALPMRPTSQALTRIKHYDVIHMSDLEKQAEELEARGGAVDDADLEMQRVSLDLMADPEIQNVYKKSYSLEDLMHLVADDDDSSTADEDDYQDGDGTTPEIIPSEGFQYQDLDQSAAAPEPEVHPAPRRPPRPLSTTEQINLLLHQDTRQHPLESANESRDNSSNSFDQSADSTAALLRPTPAPRQSIHKRSAVYDFDVDSGQNGSATSAPTPRGSSQEPEAQVSPGPRPAVRRSGAFYAGKGRESFQRAEVTSSVHATAAIAPASIIPQARADFIENKKPLVTDEFDPLLSGRVAIDPPTAPPAAASNQITQGVDDNLLRDWSLDQFQSEKSVATAMVKPTPPPLPLKQTQSLHGYPANNSALYSQPITDLIRPLASMGGVRPMPPSRPIEGVTSINSAFNQSRPLAPMSRPDLTRSLHLIGPTPYKPPSNARPLLPEASNGQLPAGVVRQPPPVPKKSWETFE